MNIRPVLQAVRATIGTALGAVTGIPSVVVPAFRASRVRGIQFRQNELQRSGGDRIGQVADAVSSTVALPLDVAVEIGYGVVQVVRDSAVAGWKFGVGSAIAASMEVGNTLLEQKTDGTPATASAQPVPKSSLDALEAAVDAIVALPTAMSVACAYKLIAGFPSLWNVVQHHRDSLPERIITTSIHIVGGTVFLAMASSAFPLLIFCASSANFLLSNRVAHFLKYLLTNNIVPIMGPIDYADARDEIVETIQELADPTSEESPYTAFRDLASLP